MIENIVLAISNAFTEFTESETFINFMQSVVDKMETIDIQQYINAFIEFVTSLVLGNG